MMNYKKIYKALWKSKMEKYCEAVKLYSGCNSGWTQPHQDEADFLNFKHHQS